MKTLVLDIETSPNIADVWQLWKQNISINQLHETTKVICFAGKFVGDKTMHFYSDHHDGHDQMIGKAWELLDQADSVVHYNGTSFDLPHLRREFLLAGAAPPSPVQEIDLLKVVRSQFRFSSNKLDHVVQQLGLGAKTKHEGHELWVACMAGDDAAWGRMAKYNKNDVLLTEALYERLRVWDPRHPHLGLYQDDDPESVCSRCGEGALRPRGFYYTALTKYQRFRCSDCGGWSRGKHALARAGARGVA